MFFIDLTSGDVVNSSGEKIITPIHFTSSQKEEFVFSFLNGNQPFILPENAQIVIAGDVAEHYPVPMFIAYGTVSADRKSAAFLINTFTEEYLQRVKASSTPCIVDISLYDQLNEQYKRLIRFNAVADLKLDITGRPPEPLRQYYTSEQIDELFTAREPEFSASEVRAVMLEHGETPYADLTVNKENNQYKLSFTIAVPAGKTGADGTPGLPGAPGENGAPGPQGEPGPTGYTPQKGIDYWTADDVSEIKSYVDSAILNGEW